MQDNDTIVDATIYRDLVARLRPQRRRYIIRRTQSHTQLSIFDRIKPQRTPRITPAEKVCKTCGIVQPQAAFRRHQTSKDGLHFECITCTNARNRHRYQTSAATRLKEQARSRFRKYGVTQEEFDALLSAQNSACAICGSSTHGGKHWHVDHDHNTGAIRGILCHGCNVALGGMRDNPAILRAGADYLEKHGK